VLSAKLEVANGSFGSGTGWMKFGSGQFRVKSIWVGYGFGSGKVRVRIYFGSIMSGSGTGSVRLKFGSGLLRVVLQYSVRVGYGFGSL